ncbi:BMC domain-containing protein [Desulfofundulus thermosubterraneus]|uniref:Carboxysome shell and ethanolamine utilization microcompartment protein CcmL/EutN n=1 Tax=Desulfofundulus thermosubterraneus DSM 16057 TaxID=1121432 RepID=A0A1M6DX48_9FIRM|nr:BMC domain-containing protein [Desulfofundulus thermosubterraneus]SHI77699.1 Carboxysome shell and ethanolamine utilization microcompartment protein CcmL/EutN [Desulfofundulus thermosubterraneus DSM 16057]
MNTLGMVEWRGIARGIAATDALLKSSPVELVLATPVCPGKFVTMISGEVGAVHNAVRTAVDFDSENVVDSLVLGTVHPSVVPALTGTAAVPAARGSLGVIETFACAAAIKAGDAAAKGGQVQLLEIRLARGLGGKSMVFLQGEVAAVQSAVGRAVAAVENGLIVGVEVISSLHRSLWEKLF